MSYTVRIMASSVVLRSLSILLGIFFIFVGTMKLTPKISKDMYKELRQDFVKFAKAFPMQQALGYKVPSKWYRRVVGGVEVVCGFILAMIPHKKMKKIANIVLLVLMAGTAYTHYAVNNRFERAAPGIVFIFMLACRLVVEWQINRREKKIVTTNEKKE